MTTTSGNPRARSATKVVASRSGEAIRLEDRDLFGERIADLGVEFLRRVFALDEIACVEIDRERTTAWVHRADSQSSLTEFLGRLAAAIRRAGAAAGSEIQPEDGLRGDLCSSRGVVTIRRVGTILTTLHITQPGGAKTPGFGLANTTLGLAIAGEVVAPRCCRPARSCWSDRTSIRSAPPGASSARGNWGCLCFMWASWRRRW